MQIAYIPRFTISTPASFLYLLIVGVSPLSFKRARSSAPANSRQFAMRSY